MVHLPPMQLCQPYSIHMGTPYLTVLVIHPLVGEVARMREGSSQHTHACWREWLGKSLAWHTWPTAARYARRPLEFGNCPCVYVLGHPYVLQAAFTFCSAGWIHWLPQRLKKDCCLCCMCVALCRPCICVLFACLRLTLASVPFLCVHLCASSPSLPSLLLAGPGICQVTGSSHCCLQIRPGVTAGSCIQCGTAGAYMCLGCST